MSMAGRKRKYQNENQIDKMKLQRLEIHNIASIEDAVIEFDKAPLAQDPIFLISGDTGSGKTTILNAICLALYDQSPNLTLIGSSEADDEGNRIDNTIQLVRRGTVEAFVRLSFEGNDSKGYVAEWAARRARGKISGKFQDISRSLYSVETGLSITKKTEIKERILELTGLNFEQFCRTTLLAQGQFSKFMNSTNDEKSAILEKLTGTEIYARIGREVNTRFKTVRDDFGRLEAEIGGASLLDEETKKEYADKISAADAQIRILLEKQKQTDVKIDWLSKSGKLASDLDSARTELSGIEAEFQSETVKEKARITALWDKTEDIRELFRRETALEKSIVADENSLSALSARYAAFLSGKAWLQSMLESDMEKVRALEDALKEDDSNMQMYAALESIRSAFRTLSAKRRQLKEVMEQSANALELRNELESGQTAAAGLASDAAKALEVQHALVQSLAAAAEKTDMSALSSRLNDSVNRIAAFGNAIASVEALNEKKKELQERKDILEGLRRDCAAAEAGLRETEAVLPELQKKSVALENQYKGRMDMKAHIVELRQYFSGHERCPLCGSHVEGLYGDAVLDSAVEEAKQSFAAAKAEYEGALQNAMAFRTSMKQISDEISRLSGQEARLLEVMDSIGKKAASQCQDCGLSFEDADVAQLLASGQAAAVLEKARLEGELEEAAGKAAVLENERKKEAAMLSEKERKDAALRSIVDRIKEQDNILKSQELLREALEKDLRETVACLASAVSIETDMEFPEPEKLLDRITDMAGHNRKMRMELDGLVKCVDAVSNELKNSAAPLQFLSTVFALPSGVSPVQMPDMSDSLHVYVNDVNRLLGSLKSSRESLEAVKASVSGYFSAEPACGEDELRRLAQTDRNEIAACRDFLAGLRKRYDMQKGAVGSLEQQVGDHARLRPEYAEEENLEYLLAMKEGLAASLSTLNDDRVTWKTRLDDDLKRTAELQDKKDRLEKLRRERDNWAALDDAFGGANGDKFKRLAQSFVLRALLVKANYYLAMLSERYELQCNDSSLAINVIDHYQGDLVRNVGSLSGGEGFIVSLALALGLSSISKDRINVDTLFIDEGFGTLSAECLEVVINTLDRLHRIGGRRVGVISHVSELSSRIPTQIRLVRTSPSSSKVEVVSL